jgi:hypothetical protein
MILVNFILFNETLSAANRICSVKRRMVECLEVVSWNKWRELLIANFMVLWRNVTEATWRNFIKFYNTIGQDLKHSTVLRKFCTVRNLTASQSHPPTPATTLKVRDLSPTVCILWYPGFAWLIRRVLDLLIEFIAPLYNWLQQFINYYLTHCHLPSGHSMGTILSSKWTELNWTKRNGTELNYFVVLPPVYSFSSLSDLILFCTTCIASRRIHRNHRCLYCCVYSAVA